MTVQQIRNHGVTHYPSGSDPINAIFFDVNNEGGTLAIYTSGYQYFQSGDNFQFVNTGANGTLIQDDGDGGITIHALGTGGAFLNIENTGGDAGGMVISNNGSSGLSISDTSTGGDLTIGKDGTGDILINNTGTGNIAIQANTSGSGILIEADNPIIIEALGGTTSATINLRIADGNYVSIFNHTLGSEWLRVGSAGIAMFHLPTSSAGLPGGFLWNSGGTVKIV